MKSSSLLAIFAHLPQWMAPAKSFTRSSFAVRQRAAQNQNSLTISKANPRDDLPKVAIIGGGIAGLSCAAQLAKSGKVRPTVFDTGRLRPGGRCSSRLPGDVLKQGSNSDSILQSCVVDHAAQMIKVSAEDKGPFSEKMKDWEQRGIVRQYPIGSICEVLNSNNEPFGLVALNEDQRTTFYYGSNGMGEIPRAIAEDTSFEIQQDVWVSPSNGVQYLGNKDGIGRPQWRLKAKGQTLGTFDRLVIAHNGKCADRLMSQTPAKDLHSLLQVNFAPTVPAWGGKKMTLNSIYSLIFAVRKDSSNFGKIIPKNAISLFIKNEPTLGLLSCNTRKYPTRQESPYEIWTLLSSPKYAKANKGPQENLPQELVERVTHDMLAAVERAFGVDEGSISSTVIESRLQLWGAAVPINTWSGGSPGFLYDGTFGVGACGDWLLQPSIEGAWESGRRLANWILKEKVNLGEDSTVGLPSQGGKFERVKTANGIASFENKERATA